MSVDFTFQTEGRYNKKERYMSKLVVDFTFQTEGRYNTIDKMEQWH